MFVIFAPTINELIKCIQAFLIAYANLMLR